MARRTLVDLFEDLAGLEREYVVHDDGLRRRTRTYREIVGAARAFAARIAEAGIARSDKVLIWSESRPEWIAAFWGCVLRGAVVVPIDHHSSISFVRQVRAIVGARLVLIGDAAGIEPGSEVGAEIWRLADLAWQEGPATPPADLDGDDVAEIVFTSGATAQPKGVVLTHRNILANLVGPERIVRRHRRWFRPLGPLRFLCLIPLSHMFGQTLALFLLPAIPATVVFIHRYGPDEIVRQIRRRRITAAVVVPQVLQVLRAYLMRRFPEATEPDCSHWMRRWFHFRRIHRHLGWRFWAFVAGGAPLDRDLEEFWWKVGLPVVQGYGLTETAPIVAFNNPFAIRRGTAGAVVAGTEVRIAPDGEIVVRGENVSPGYFGAPAEASAAFHDGWFHTGDLGELDAAGNLVIRGRKKEVIVTPDGRNVYPDDVEAVLQRLPGVREVAVVGHDAVHAVMIVGSGADPDAIVRAANARLEDHERIKAFRIWPGARLPRTEATGKIKRAAVQVWLERGEPAPPGPAGATVAEIVGRHAPGRKVSPQTTLDELGLDSLERIELLLDLEQSLGASIDESSLVGHTTVAALESLDRPAMPTPFPAWNRAPAARVVRRAALATVLLPLTRCLAHLHVVGREHLDGLRGPVLFAANHQSHLDTPVILAALPARYRHRTAVAMWKEYFDATFFPERHAPRERLLNGAIYVLAALLFNGFPLPQTEARAGESLRYMGELVSDGWSLLVFPEGERSHGGEIRSYRAGIGFIAARLDLPVVPIRLTGLDLVLHRTARFPRPGRVRIAFGAPLSLRGDGFEELAGRVQRVVSEL
jgi:long-chain acyl-CoA synthetase